MASPASPTFTVKEIGMIAQALRLSASSCERLSKREGQSDRAAAAYRDEANDIRQLLFKVSQFEGKV